MNAHATRSFSHHVECSNVIQAPPERVWETLADFHHVDRWTRRVIEVERLGSVDRGVGMRRRVTVERVGSFEELVDVWLEGKQLGYQVEPFSVVAGASTRWNLEPLGSCCRAHLTMDYDIRFGLIGAVLHKMVIGRLIARRARDVLAMLKRFVEVNATQLTSREHSVVGEQEEIDHESDQASSHQGDRGVG